MLKLMKVISFILRRNNDKGAICPKENERAKALWKRISSLEIGYF